MIKVERITVGQYKDQELQEALNTLAELYNEEFGAAKLISVTAISRTSDPAAMIYITTWGVGLI